MTAPRASQLAALVVYGTGSSGTSRTRAWTFVLDGHTFYVLDLGEEGTFLYDITTKQWSEFQTEGYTGWNMHNGTMWGEGRIAGGDAMTGLVWELNPSLTIDEGFRDLTHVATGILVTRNRVFKALESFRLAASSGFIGSDGATISLRWSDNNGRTWSDYYPVTLVEDDFDQEIAWRSIGSFKAPGRVFEISDVGGVIRIDGADAGVDDFDEDGQP